MYYSRVWHPGRGAHNELRQALTELDSEQVSRILLKQRCDYIEFKINVPLASHMGCTWEPQICSVCSILEAMLEDSGPQLDEESLRTLMYEVSAIINNRPLTTDNLNDPESLEPLTLNHLLTMKLKVLLSSSGVLDRAELYSRKRWRRMQYLCNEFWVRWRKEYLLILQPRQK